MEGRERSNQMPKRHSLKAAGVAKLRLMQDTAGLHGDSSIRRGVVDGFRKRPHAAIGVIVGDSRVF